MKYNVAVVGATGAVGEELFRVMVHGTLHLLGYGDKSESEKALMTEKENFYLNQLKE